MKSNTQSDGRIETNEAPGAVYVLPGEQEEVYVIEGKPADENRELAAEIVADLRSIIEEASSPSREIRCALSSHRGDRANIDMVGEFPGLNHGFGEDTRFSEVFFAQDGTKPPESAVEIGLP